MVAPRWRHPREGATVGIVTGSAPLARAQVPPLGTCAQWQNKRRNWINKRNNGDLGGMSQAA